MSLLRAPLRGLDALINVFLGLLEGFWQEIENADFLTDEALEDDFAFETRRENIRGRNERRRETRRSEGEVLVDVFPCLRVTVHLEEL